MLATASSSRYGNASDAVLRFSKPQESMFPTGSQWHCIKDFDMQAPMRRRTSYFGNFRAPACRRLFVLFVAAAYLLVGFAGEVSCAEETLFTSLLLSVSAPPDEVDEGAKKTPTVVDHCYTCAAITIPVATQVFVPASAPISLSFSIHTIPIWEARLLDPPPPRA